VLCHFRDGALLYKHYNVLLIYQIIEEIFKHIYSVRSYVNETGHNQLRVNVQNVSYHRFLHLFQELMQ
jgi:hypothetical protein